MNAAITSAPPLPPDSALEARLASESLHADAEEFVALAPRLAGIGRARIAFRIAQRAIEVAEREGDLLLRIKALRARARSQSEMTEYTGVVRSLLEAQSLNREAGDAEQELRILSTLGLAYGKLGVRAEAIASHEAALALASHGNPALEAECYGNLGVTLLNCERSAEAVVYMRQARALAEQGDDEAVKLRARVNLNATRAAAADWQLRRGENDDARAELRAVLADCEDTLAACRAAKAEAFELPVMQHIGIVHKCLGNVDVAHACFAEVTTIARERGWKRLEMDVLLHVGGLQSTAGEFAAAEESLTRALAYFEAAEYKTSILETHLELAKLFERTAAFERAYNTMKVHHQLRLEMAASEESLRLQVRTWREEYDAMQREAQDAQRAAAALLSQNNLLAERNRSLDHDARHDPLTGLANRRFGDAWIEHQFTAHTAQNRVMALAVVDIDQFKAINDRYSHVAGDAVLRVTADLLRAACRDSDMAIRFGGDEFLLGFPDTTVAQAEAICERLRLQFSRHPWRLLGRGLRVSATIGIADSAGARTVLDLLRAADTRLYAAKEAGRNRVA